jgi:hypothetical protein
LHCAAAHQARPALDIAAVLPDDALPGIGLIDDDRDVLGSAGRQPRQGDEDPR